MEKFTEKYETYKAMTVHFFTSVKNFQAFNETATNAVDTLFPEKAVTGAFLSQHSQDHNEEDESGRTNAENATERETILNYSN